MNQSVGKRKQKPIRIAAPFQARCCRIVIGLRTRLGREIENTWCRYVLISVTDRGVTSVLRASSRANRSRRQIASSICSRSERSSEMILVSSMKPCSPVHLPKPVPTTPGTWRSGFRSLPKTTGRDRCILGDVRCRSRPSGIADALGLRPNP